MSRDTITSDYESPYRRDAQLVRKVETAKEVVMIAVVAAVILGSVFMGSIIAGWRPW